MGQHCFQSIPDVGVNNLSIRIKVIREERCKRRKRSVSQESLKSLYRTQEVIFDGWKLNPMMRFMMLESFCLLDQ